MKSWGWSPCDGCKWPYKRVAGLPAIWGPSEKVALYHLGRDGPSQELQQLTDTLDLMLLLSRTARTNALIRVTRSLIVLVLCFSPPEFLGEQYSKKHWEFTTGALKKNIHKSVPTTMASWVHINPRTFWIVFVPLCHLVSQKINVWLSLMRPGIGEAESVSGLSLSGHLPRLPTVIFLLSLLYQTREGNTLPLLGPSFPCYPAWWEQLGAGILNPPRLD